MTISYSFSSLPDQMMITHEYSETRGYFVCEFHARFRLSHTIMSLGSLNTLSEVNSTLHDWI